MKRLMILAVLGLFATAAHAGAVVAAKDAPFTSFDAEEAKKIFLGREPQLAGQTVVVVYQKDSPARTDFESKVVGKTGADLSAYWSKLIFTGKAQAPEEVSGDGGVKAKIGATPGAIGYVSDGAVDGSLKVLFKY
jgi:ABC-type phosphate transport system substrate-binding protein